jgi:phasin family protein
MAKEKNFETSNGNGSQQTWAFDFDKLLGPYSLAGVDYSKMLERERKNIEALSEANKIAFEGWKALIGKQSEIFEETMSHAIASARKQDMAKARMELAKEGFEKALSDMREIAAMAAQYQHEAFNLVHERIGQHMDELREERMTK